MPSRTWLKRPQEAPASGCATSPRPARRCKNAVDRAGRFLSLASLVSVLLCAIAVAMAARRYVHRHLDTVALLKTLGATRAFTLCLSLLQLLALALMAASPALPSASWRRNGCCAPSADC